MAKSVRGPHPAERLFAGVYHVALLGGFHCMGGRGPAGPDETLQMPTGIQRIVVFLALQGSPLPRSFVAESLWPDVSVTGATTALRKQLWRLQAAHPGLLQVDRNSLVFGDGVGIDLHAERARYSHLLNMPLDEVNVVDVEWALSKADGTQTLLPGWYDDWVIVEQERWSQLQVHALERASDVFRRASRWSAAVDAALAAVAADPFRETSVRLLIEAYVAEGNALKAALAFATFHGRAEAEFGFGASADFRAWAERTLAGKQAELGAWIQAPGGRDATSDAGSRADA